MIFIINGEHVPTPCTGMLFVAVRCALANSGNGGRNPEDWELRDERGTLLDQGRTAYDYGFNADTHAYVSLRLGAGGDTDAD